jgi:hypothetical protein
MKHERVVEQQQSGGWDERLRTFIGFLVVIDVVCLALWLGAHLVAALEIFEGDTLALGAILAVWLYFLFHGSRHRKKMQDLEQREYLATIRHRETITRLLDDTHKMRHNYKTNMEGALEVIHQFPPPVKVTEIKQEPLQIEAPQVRQPSMDEIYGAIRFNALEVGFGNSIKTGQIVVQGIIQGVHFKLVGASGFGKSCLAGSLLDQATRRNDADHLRIALLDLEHKTSRLFEHVPHIMTIRDGKRTISLVATSADEVARHLAYLRKELDNRAMTERSTPLLLMYVEEMLSLQYEVDDRLKDQMLADLAILALRGRKYGMFLLACTQTDYSTKELREAQKQFRTRSGFAVDPSAARAAGFVNNDLIKYNFANALPGRFVLEKPGFSELVFAPLYDVEQKLLELQPATSRRIVDATSEPLPSHFPTDEYEDGGNHAGKQPEVEIEKLAVVREMVARRKSQNEIISRVFPGMRNAEAIEEFRKYLAALVNA